MKVAIVTAASRGIGAACARELNACGYRLALLARSESVLHLAGELNAVGIQGSVTDSESLQRLVTKTLDAYGQIDAVVNNTGDPPGGKILEISDAAWHENLDLLLLNVVRLSRLVTPIMLAQGGGSLVNISAADAYEPDLRFPLGSTLRAALGAFTKLYATEYAENGIRMNCVLPGIIMDFDPGQSRPDIQAEVPMRRPGRYEEIAKAAAYLLSADASYITGQNIRVDGGLTRSV